MKRISGLLVSLCVIITAFANIANALDQTSTGFYYPIGKSSFDQACGTWLGQDGKEGRSGCYFEGLYHIGVDMMTRDVDARAYAIADGTIFFRHCPQKAGGDIGWGTDNCALLISHKTANGNVFTGLYGHLSKDSLPKDNEVYAGDEIGKTGYYSGGIHLHFGIRWGDSISPSPWGRMDNKDWPETSNFINPLAFIERERPFSENISPYLFSSHAYTGSGEVEGGANTNYNYSLPIKKSQFTIDETAKAMIRVENIKVRHRWLAEIWQSGVKQRDYDWSWNEVGSGWSASYFWPEQELSSSGDYQFKVYLYLGDDSQRDHIVDLNFTAVKPDNWQPYAYDGNGYTGYGPPEGGANTNWNYSLSRKTTTFYEGDHVYGLARINDVYVNHNFKVKTYRNNLFMYEYEWGLNNVNSGRWSTSYFWPELNNASAGNWEFKIYLEYDGKAVLLSTLPFTVSKPDNWQPYAYDGNGYTGHGPVQGGESADWRYWLSDKTKAVDEGDTLYGILRLDQVKLDHRFKVETYRSGIKKWEWAMPDFNRVGSGWDYAHFYFGFNKVWPGDWRFDVLINTVSDGRNNWQLIDSLYFTVNKKSQPPNPPSIRYNFNHHNAQGWTTGYDVAYTEQNQADKDTWMVIASGPNPGVISPELPPGFTALKTPNLRFSVKIRGDVRNTYGQIWLMDNNGAWGYPAVFRPVKVDYNYYEYSINLAHLGDIPIQRFSIELTQEAPYEQWIFDWVELK